MMETIFFSTFIKLEKCLKCVIEYQTKIEIKRCKMLSRKKIIILGISSVVVAIVATSIIPEMIRSSIYAPDGISDPSKWPELPESQRQQILEKMDSLEVKQVFLEKYPDALVKADVHTTGQGNIRVEKKFENSFLFLSISYSPYMDQLRWHVYCKEGREGENSLAIWSIGDDEKDVLSGYERQYDVLRNNECRSEKELSPGDVLSPAIQNMRYPYDHYFDAQLVADTIEGSEIYKVFMQKYPFAVAQNDQNPETGLGYYHLVAEKDTHSAVLSFRNVDPGEYFRLDLICTDWEDWEEGTFDEDRMEFHKEGYLLWEEHDGFEDVKRDYNDMIDMVKTKDCFE